MYKVLYDYVTYKAKLSLLNKYMVFIYPLMAPSWLPRTRHFIREPLIVITTSSSEHPKIVDMYYL